MRLLSKDALPGGQPGIRWALRDRGSGGYSDACVKGSSVWPGDQQRSTEFSRVPIPCSSTDSRSDPCYGHVPHAPHASHASHASPHRDKLSSTRVQFLALQYLRGTVIFHFRMAARAGTHVMISHSFMTTWRRRTTRPHVRKPSEPVFSSLADPAPAELPVAQVFLKGRPPL